MQAEPRPSPTLATELTNRLGALAPPRKNGELVFDAPWQARVFGLAMVLGESGLVDWQELVDRLSNQIGQSDQESTDAYYGRWLAVVETLAAEKGLLSPAELAAHTAELAAIGPEDEHDHEHGHGHSHDHHG